MTIKNYQELNSLEIDTLREIGSIGTGNAATSLSGVLVHIGGQMNGIMLSVQPLEFINIILQRMLSVSIQDYSQLQELERSALVEVGNIMISTFINAMSNLADMKVELTVPSLTVDMQGAILTVPMAEYGGQSDYLMTIGGNFSCDGHELPCRLILSPDIRSLNFLLRKLGVEDG